MNKILKVLLTANMFLFQSATTDSSITDHFNRYANHIIKKDSGLQGDVFRALNSGFHIYKNLIENADFLKESISGFNKEIGDYIGALVYGEKIPSSVGEIEMQDFSKKDSITEKKELDGKNELIVEEIEIFKVISEGREVASTEKIINCICTGFEGVFDCAKNAIDSVYAKNSTKEAQKNEGIELSSMNKNTAQNSQNSIIIEGIDDFSKLSEIAAVTSNVNSSKEEYDQSNIIVLEEDENEHGKEKIARKDYADILKNGSDKQKRKLTQKLVDEDVIIIEPSSPKKDDENQGPIGKKAGKVTGAKNIDISNKKEDVQSKSSFTSYVSNFVRGFWG